MGKSSFLQEFKAFAMKGNVIDMAVGVIIGGAFGKIVSSIVADVIMPPENPNATQKEVDNAKATLEKAIVGLQANSSTPVDNTANTPVNNGDTTVSVKTGDESLAGMFATIALLNVAGYTLLKRKENN